MKAQGPPSNEDILKRGGTPIPDNVRKAVALEGAFDRYIPKYADLKFFRMQLADFNPVVADHMKLWLYHDLVEFKWLRRADVQYKIDHAPKPNG